MYLFYHSLVQTIGSVVYCKNVNKIDNLDGTQTFVFTYDRLILTNYSLSLPYHLS